MTLKVNTNGGVLPGTITFFMGGTHVGKSTLNDYGADVEKLNALYYDMTRIVSAYHEQGASLPQVQALLERLWDAEQARKGA